MRIMPTKKTIKEIKELFAQTVQLETLINELRNDGRAGVQRLIKQYEKAAIIKQAQEAAFKQMRSFEEQGWTMDYEYIAGVDEAGRGPLAGPVVAAAVILPKEFKLLGLDDSKKLSRKQRKSYFNFIKENALSYQISVVYNEIIDEINILAATKQAMLEAITGLSIKADYVLIDAVELTLENTVTKSIIKGDQKSISIAAASILAKETRDLLMEDYAKTYPHYEFTKHMGYGTKQHLDKIATYGITPIHRKSFAPVKNAFK